MYDQESLRFFVWLRMTTICCQSILSAAVDFVIDLHVQSGNKTERSTKGGAVDMWLVFFWTGPIGVGIFLLCLGGMVYLLKKADEVDKRTKAYEKEKGLEKK